MAAPIANKITLPSDVSNTGKNVRTQTKVIGADTVHEHYFIPISRRRIVSKYGFVSALQSVSAAAQTNNTGGFLWLQIPAGSTIRARLRKLIIQISCVTELDHLTIPRIVITRFTFTGTASGAVIAPARATISAPTGESADAAPVSQLRTAITGMTATYESGYYWAASMPTLLLTTSGLAWADSRQIFEPENEDEFFDIGPGEGIVIWQPDAGTASDGRRFVISGTLDEYDNA